MSVQVIPQIEIIICDRCKCQVNSECLAIEGLGDLCRTCAKDLVAWVKAGKRPKSVVMVRVQK